MGERTDLIIFFAVYSTLVASVIIVNYFYEKKRKAVRSAVDGTESGDVGDDAMVDHFLAGRQTPLFIIVLSTFSTIFSGYTMVGVPNETNSKGFTSLRWVQAINSIIISMIIFVPRMRGLAEKRNYTSTVDFITDRYRSESLRLIMIAIMVISDIIYCIGQFAAISSLIETVTNGQIKGIYMFRVS